MNSIFGFVIILFFLVAGEAVSTLIGHFVPGSVLGMILLFLALCMKLIREEWVRSASDFLTKNMTVLFIPASIGIVEQWGLIRMNLISWVLIVFVCWAMVLGSAGWTVHLISRRRKK